MADGWYTDRTGARYAFVPIGKGKRINVRLVTCTTDEEAATRASLVRELAASLRTAAKDEYLEGVVDKAAKATTADELASLRRIVKGIVAGVERRATTKSLGVTFRDVARQWTQGELHALYPDEVAKKRSVGMDISRINALDDLVGDLLVTDPNWLDHAQAAMRRLPKRVKESGARRQYAQAMRRVLQLAVYPLRLIPSNPLPPGFLPKVTQTRALQMPYPDEDAALLAHTPIPVVYRLAYGFLARMGFRKSEIIGGEDEEVEGDEPPAEPLTWDRIDLARGVVYRGRSKTDKPVPIPLDAGVVRALAAWKRLQPPASDAAIVFADAAGVVVELGAEAFRDRLTAAGVTRIELHTRTKDNAAVRVHDLRALFVTTSLAAGKPDTWVRDRTSHRTITMLERYRRQARLFEELELGALVPLDEAIPELRPTVGEASDGGASSRQTGSADDDSRRETANSMHLAAGPKPFDSSYEGSNPSVGTHRHLRPARRLGRRELSRRRPFRDHPSVHRRIPRTRSRLQQSSRDRR